MKINATTLALLAAVIGAAGLAAYTNNGASASAPSGAAASPAAAMPESPPPASNVNPSAGGTHQGTHGSNDEPPLPPNHPPIGQGPGATQAADMPAASNEAAALKWKAPAAWPIAPNPNSMRLETHKIPHAAGDADDAELSISRAGGDTDANIQRWVDQLGGAGREKRRAKTIQGFKVSIVEVDGTFAGGMGAASEPRKGWALMGAIVETPGQAYFFKVTGPAATVHAARTAFDAMMESISAN